MTHFWIILGTTTWILVLSTIGNRPAVPVIIQRRKIDMLFIFKATVSFRKDGMGLPCFVATFNLVTWNTRSENQFCSKFAVKTFPCSVANADIGSLCLSIHSFKNVCYHMLVKFEQNRMVETTRTFELLTKNRVFLNQFWQSADAILKDVFFCTWNNCLTCLMLKY